MTSKRVKNEQWYVKDLISKIDKGEIVKPKFQRKRKWDLLLKKETTPNEQSYIQFLFEVKNSVHPVTFGQNMNSHKITYTNIDGNNRLNAIKHFMDKPFEIFLEYLQELFNYISNRMNDIEKKDKEFLKKMFSTISYNDIIDMKVNKYFNTINMLEFYTANLKSHRDEFDEIIETIQTKLKINGTDRFDYIVSINVNLFEGYNTDELCNIFEEINKFNTKLSEIELLACRLYNITDFKINNSIIRQAIINEIIEIYKEKSENEALSCYIFEKEDTINAFDFMVGFQNYCHTTHNGVIEKTDNEGLSLFFKLYKTLYNGLSVFNSVNINDFIDNINYACSVLNKIYKKIFTEQINNSLFNKTCENKFSTLKKNNIYLLISSIIGYKKLGINENVIIISIEKSILFHFFVSEIKDVDKKEQHRFNDMIQYEAGGGYIDTVAKKMVIMPSNISDKITKNAFTCILNDLLTEGNKPILRVLENGNKQKNKRRDRKFSEKCLLFYYYKAKVPVNLLNNKFSLEHITPFSCNWSKELDIDRIGNIFPIIDEINIRRSNHHIKAYNEYDVNHNFIKFIDVIPNIQLYDTVVSHADKTPVIISNEKYVDLCLKNEEKYIDNFIKCLYN